jgi:hypothetical protein
MLMTASPNRLTFWRLVLGIFFPIACLSLSDAFSLAGKLGIAPLASKSWLAILSMLALIGLLDLVLLVLTFVPTGKKLFNDLENLPKVPTWLALTIFAVILLAFPLFYLHPYYGDLFGKQSFIRLFLFFLFSLAGMFALKLAFPSLEFSSALAFALLSQAAANLFVTSLPDISTYPFAMGWAETSRLYYPSLFLSRLVYGQPFPWPILHPSLHLLLAPPYLIDAPLWFQRAWQVFMRFALVGLITPALLSRLKIESRIWRWFASIWILVYLFTIPLYMHLAVIVFTMLWGYSSKSNRRTWFWLILASVWAGWSRLNWFPMPGILAAILYLLEVPYLSRTTNGEERSMVYGLWSVIIYLAKPILWIIAGTTIAFASQRAYIALSGVPAATFYTSLSSDLLWYRLWPSASYSLGVLPGILLFALPILLWLGFAPARRELHPLRQALFGLGLDGLFVVGIFVSMKIGGGADLHNMDVFSVPLLIIFAYLFTNSHTPESVSLSAFPLANPLAHPFLRALPLLLVIIPAWFGMRVSAGMLQYDPAAAQATLTELQRRVDKTPGEILFISQRHLVSMHMLKGVTLVPQYEREDLMELAMSRNTAALNAGLYADLQAHRFAMIIVDPLRINYLGSNYAMGEENNVWTRYIIKPILCNYKQDAVFPTDRIAIYVPQVGEQKCP